MRNRSVSMMMGLLAVTLLGALVGGCAPVTIRGVVLPGEITTIAVVNQDDPRLKTPGIAEVDVTIYQTGTQGDVRSRTSNDLGRFGVPLRGTGALSKPLTIEARGEGYSPVRKSMPTPTTNERLLIYMQPLGSSQP